MNALNSTCLLFCLVLAAGLVTVAAPSSGAAGDADAGDRIVSVGGSITEIIVGLGAGDRIVAVDTTSVHPAEAARKPNVGYMRALSAEGVLSTRPSAVIAAEGAGPPAALDLIRSAGIPVLTVPEEASEAGVLRKIDIVARLIGATEAGAALHARTVRGFQRLADIRQAGDATLRVLFVLSFQNGRPLAAGAGTAADGMLRLAGVTNAGSGFDGYKPMTDEAVIAARPDAVVMMDRPGVPAPAALFALPAFSQTPAAKAQALVTMDGLYLLGFGPRTPDAAGELLLALRSRAGPGVAGAVR